MKKHEEKKYKEKQMEGQNKENIQSTEKRFRTGDTEKEDLKKKKNMNHTKM